MKATSTRRSRSSSAPPLPAPGSRTAVTLHGGSVIKGDVLKLSKRHAYVELLTILHAMPVYVMARAIASTRPYVIPGPRIGGAR